MFVRWEHCQLLQEENSPWWDLVLFPLNVLSLLYSSAQSLRSYLYRINMLGSYRLPCKVISVGNLTSGGTGKTPLVEYVVRLLKEEGYKVAVLSRGYRRRAAGERFAVVSNGQEILLDPWRAGDEPYLLARNLGGTPVLVGKDRYQTGYYAWENFGCQVVVLDDGYQYLRLVKDCDILLLDATRPFSNHKVIPRGLLREPITAMRRAHMLLITRVKERPNPYIQRYYRRLGLSVPIFYSRYSAEAMINIVTGEYKEITSLQGKRVVAFCGIGSPESFLEIIGRLGARVLHFSVFKDHHIYTLAELTRIKRLAQRLAADLILTTEKDAVRLLPYQPLAFPIWYLRIRIELGEDGDRFREGLLQAIQDGD